VVEPTNFELGIVGDRELENWRRCYREGIDEGSNFTRGQLNGLKGRRFKEAWPDAEGMREV
jgi:hypothetical protein